MGYRYFDTASFYETERDLARALKETGIPRNEVQIASKAWHADLYAAGDMAGRTSGFCCAEDEEQFYAVSAQNDIGVENKRIFADTKGEKYGKIHYGTGCRNNEQSLYSV